MNQAKSIAPATALLLLLGCKPMAEQSDLQSLERLSSQGSNLARNDCKGSYQADAVGENTLRLMQQQLRAPANVRAAVDNALTSVPTGLKQAFFGLGYELNYVANIDQACAGIGGFRPGYKSCARPSMVGDAEKISLYISADVGEIGHNTLIGILSTVDERMSRIDEDANSQLMLTNSESPQFSTFKRDLANAVLHSGLASGKHDFALLKDMLPRDPAFFAAGTSAQQRAQMLDAMLAQDPQRGGFLLKDIFDNAGNSFYCNQQTRNIMKTDFLAAHDMWQNSIHPDFAGDDAKSFGLRRWGGGGRWYPGRGIVRFVQNRRTVRGRGHSWSRPQSWGGGSNVTVTQQGQPSRVMPTVPRAPTNVPSAPAPRAPSPSPVAPNAPGVQVPQENYGEEPDPNKTDW